MRITAILFLFFAALAAPSFAQQNPRMTATAINPASIPNGTYTAVVEKLVDNKHVTVKLVNGAETTLTTNRPNVDFGKVKPNDNLKFSIIDGNVAVYMVTETP